jgi:hypothetical protein
MLNVTEYSSALVLAGAAPIPAEPSMRSQTVEIESASSASEPFSTATRFIRVHTDRGCALKVGAAPVATPADTRISAGGAEYFAVQPGHRIAAVAIKEAQDMDSLTALLQVLADPKASQTRAKELAVAAAVAAKAAAEAKAAAAAVDSARADITARETALKSAQQTLEAERAQLKADRGKVDSQSAQLQADSERLTAKAAELTKAAESITERERAIAAREKQVAAAEAGYSNRIAKLRELAS